MTSSLYLPHRCGDDNEKLHNDSCTLAKVWSGKTVVKKRRESLGILRDPMTDSTEEVEKSSVLCTFLASFSDVLVSR